MSVMKKAVIALGVMLMVGCTVTMIVAKDNASVENKADGGLESGLDVDLSKPKDTIINNQKQ